MGTLTRTQEAIDLSNAITDLGATGGEWDTLLDAALAAERSAGEREARRATVERIRERVGAMPWGTTASSINRKGVLAILDEALAAPSDKAAR